MGSLRRSDILIALGLIALSGIYTLKHINLSLHPFEDAAILMRYATNLAKGYGIVWNVGEEPVDGATDFLFMAVLALIVKSGLSMELATRSVGTVSHLLTVALVYLAVRDIHRSRPWMALISASYLAVGPASRYVSAYFGTTFFTLFVCAAWYVANRLLKKSDSWLWSIVFSIFSLAMGLVRPEGVFVGILMLVAMVYARGWKRSKKLILGFVLVFGVLGGAYFLWRWNYFGYPLPNPFYKKGGGLLYKYSLLSSVRNLVSLGFPFLAVFVIALRSSAALKTAAFAMIPVLGFTSLWILVSHEANHWARFQYPILPVILISWPSVLDNIRRDFSLPGIADLAPRGRLALAVLVFLVSFGILWKQHRRHSGISRYRDGRYDVALLLAEYRTSNYTLVTTEAGLLPLYSGWKTIDAWGLNDKWIAHHGKIDKRYLDHHDPEVIMFHDYSSPLVPQTARGDPWSDMVTTLKEYAEARGYVLAGSFGSSPFNTHYYYVRPGFPDSSEIIERVRHLDYFWYRNGRKSINYARVRMVPEDN